MTLSISIVILGHFIFLRHFAVAMSNEWENTNLQRLEQLLEQQRHNLIHLNGIDNEEGLTEYQKCLEAEQMRLDYKYIMGPFYKMAIEDVDLTLECSPCIPSGHWISWTKLTFETFQTELKRTDLLNESSLVLTSPKADPNPSTYYCSWLQNKNGREVIQNIWTVEIIKIDEFKRVTRKTWKNDNDPSYISPEDNVDVDIDWEEWSDCSQCGKVGKKHRIGYCSVRILDFSDEPHEYKALEIFSTSEFGISCNLFQTYHPDVLHNNPLRHHLTQDNLLMIGYCKVFCNYNRYDASSWVDPYSKFLSYPESLRELYKRDRPNHAENATWTFAKLKVFIRGLKDIPMTTDYIPEVLAISALVLLQTIILVQICRNRRHAK